MRSPSFKNSQEYRKPTPYSFQVSSTATYLPSDPVLPSQTCKFVIKPGKIGDPKMTLKKQKKTRSYGSNYCISVTDTLEITILALFLASFATSSP